MLIFDTETTGLVENMSTRADRQPEVIEFAGLKIDPVDGKIIDKIDLLIRPKFDITPEITKMNGITNEMVETAPSFASVASTIAKFIELSDCAVAHNAAFDRDMLNLEFGKLGNIKLAWPHIICTVEQTIHLTGYRLSLSDLYQHLFGERFSGAHRAMVDVEALARCVVELRKRGEL